MELNTANQKELLKLKTLIDKRIKKEENNLISAIRNKSLAGIKKGFEFFNEEDFVNIYYANIVSSIDIFKKEDLNFFKKACASVNINNNNWEYTSTVLKLLEEKVDHTIGLEKLKDLVNSPLKNEVYRIFQRFGGSSFCSFDPYVTKYLYENSIIDDSQLTAYHQNIFSYNADIAHKYLDVYTDKFIGSTESEKKKALVFFFSSYHKAGLEKCLSVMNKTLEDYPLLLDVHKRAGISAFIIEAISSNFAIKVFGEEKNLDFSKYVLLNHPMKNETLKNILENHIQGRVATELWDKQTQVLMECMVEKPELLEMTKKLLNKMPTKKPHERLVVLRELVEKVQLNQELQESLPNQGAKTKIKI